MRLEFTIFFPIGIGARAALCAMSSASLFDFDVVGITFDRLVVVLDPLLVLLDFLC